MTSNKTAAALYAASFAANQKLKKNLDAATFISLTRREEDPFVVYADLLNRLEVKAKEATAAWTEVAKNLSTEEIVEIIVNS